MRKGKSLAWKRAWHGTELSTGISSKEHLCAAQSVSHGPVRVHDSGTSQQRDLPEIAEGREA